MKIKQFLFDVPWALVQKTSSAFTLWPLTTVKKLESYPHIFYLKDEVKEQV